MKKDRHPRLSRDGLPVDAKVWTVADWRTLHLHLEAVKRKVAARHRDEEEAEEEEEAVAGLFMCNLSA